MLWVFSVTMSDEKEGSYEDGKMGKRGNPGNHLIVEQLQMAVNQNW
jgi:hypothetical protein